MIQTKEKNEKKNISELKMCQNFISVHFELSFHLI